MASARRNQSDPQVDDLNKRFTELTSGLWFKALAARQDVSHIELDASARARGRRMDYVRRLDEAELERVGSDAVVAQFISEAKLKLSRCM